MRFLSVLAMFMLPYLSFADTANVSMDDKPSFDCSKTKTSIDAMVCDSKELSKLDKQLSISYHDALSKGNKQSIKEWQKVWLYNDRGSCNDPHCLEKVYESQISKLREFVKNISKDSISGKYQRYYNGRLDKHISLINIYELDSNRVQIVGSSIWIGNIETGNVNTGEAYGEATLIDNRFNYEETSEDGNGCQLRVVFYKNSLVVTDENLHCGGLNVSFGGEYRKVIHQ
ncbi:hypothetical protein B649_02905 [Candidatus Sulfuricurvum sp. RIFRC-1]|nr:hypothetical protein B649_02905 [Candidatus Sulfuricurvum sp. RIFRC-1]HBM35775.1 hypothetical protein [Sulfuricurvum sp.]